MQVCFKTNVGISGNVDFATISADMKPVTDTYITGLNYDSKAAVMMGIFKNAATLRVYGATANTEYIMYAVYMKSA